MLGLPAADHVDEAGAARMAVMLQMMLVVGLALHPGSARLEVHEARVPVAMLGLALRPPMRPDAELGIAEPLGDPVARRERLPGRSDRHCAGGRCERRRAGRGQSLAAG